MIDELLREIADKHGVALGRDDPVLIVHTLHERLLRESAAAQADLLHRFEEQLEALTDRWGQHARAEAERIVQAARTEAQTLLSSTAEHNAQAVAAAVRRELAQALARAEVPVQTNRVLVYLNLAASALTMLALTWVLWRVI